MILKMYYQCLEERKKNLNLRSLLRKGNDSFVKTSYGTLAQLVEHRTENPGVPGSIPGGTTKALT